MAYTKYFKENDGGRSKWFDCTLKKNREIGDCVVRTIAIATDIPYGVVWNELFDRAKTIGHFPNNRIVYETYLKELGWVKHPPLRYNNRKIEIRDFIDMITEQERIYAPMIILTRGHITALIDNKINDTWDCSDYCMNSYYQKESKND